MGLDDRLRTAHQRRLSDTRRRLADNNDHNYDEPVDPTIPLRRSSRALAIAAAVAVLAGGTLAVTTPWDDGGSINTDLGPAGEQTTVDQPIDSDDQAAPGIPDSSGSPISSDQAVSGDSDSDSGESEATSPGSTAASSSVPATDAGVASDVCASGRRATLEKAELRYVSDNQGWDRLDDLVDEQDGPYYFSGWEPGYPDDVTVEVQLAEPALAQDIRIAQDPYTPVSGLIAIGVVGEGFNLEMSGTGGWRVHDFGEPRLVGSFTINRQNPEANVMEVLICLADSDPAPGEPEGPGNPGTPPTTGPGGPTTTPTTIGDPGNTTTTAGNTTTTAIDIADPHPQTPGVRDSFGEVVAPVRAAMAWRGVDGYYEQTRAGQCPKSLHDSYWVEGADGGIYPTWHPIDHPSGCSFMHSHGDDPRSSDLYRDSQGLPFGMAAQAQAPGGTNRRNEDHVGHKVVRQDDWRAVEGNPVNDGDQLRSTNITCQWLSKIHQGTYSPDALGNNMHEYFLNLSCTDGTEIRAKEMAFWGEPGKIFNECSSSATSRFGFTKGWIDAGIPAIPNREAPYFHDGKREFQCVPDVLYRGDGQLSELWKPDGQMSTPEGGSVLFSPYYIVTNPARVVDPNWRSHGLDNAWVATIDFCFDDTEAWANYVTSGREPTFCRDVPASLGSVPRNQRWSHPDSPFDGSQTAIHPKGPMIFNGGRTRNHPDGTLFCTDAFGQNPTWADGDGNCGPNQLVQLIGTVDNNWAGRISGSDVNAGASLIAPGIGNEWVRDFGSSVNVPN